MPSSLTWLTTVVAVTTLISSRVVQAMPLSYDQVSPSNSEQMLAQSLFEEGRRLMDSGKFAEACLKLAASLRLDPGAGTQLNLAVCHEQEGKLSTALLEFEEASRRALKDGRRDRERI